MDRLSLPAISLAGPKMSEAAVTRSANRSTNSQPVKQAPLPEPAPTPVRVDPDSTKNTSTPPISLPPTVDASGRITPDKLRGTVLNLTA